MIYKVIIERVSYDRYSVSLNDKVVCRSTGDPEHAACRYLKSIGCTGKIHTYWKGSNVCAMKMDIDWGAGHCTLEAPTKGPITVKYRLPGRVSTVQADLG